MREQDFTQLLDQIASQLTSEARNNTFSSSKQFENRVREVLEGLGTGFGISVNYDPHPYAFPDIAFGEFGIEVKFTSNDTWRSIANSVFESFRTEQVSFIYVLFGKMGGTPEVRWDRYADCVIHVRTSHVPRFELEINAKSSLFDKMQIEYRDFSVLPVEKKMHYVREYARNRLKDGERLWWLEEKPEQEHSLPIQVRLYMDLPTVEKRRLRGQAALLCPQVVAGSRVRNKYNDAAMFLLTYHGVLCPQARDLFSAGSVALRSSDSRGGIYIQRALIDIEDEMRSAASILEQALFVEYWGREVPAENRIHEWLNAADKLASGWTPSTVLFKEST